MRSKRLLVVAHAPSPNTQALVDAVLRGARHPDIEGVETVWIKPLEAQPGDLLQADALVLGTTENFGYMSGALKDFFDRCYYPVLEQKQGLPYALYVRAGNDGRGTVASVTRIVTGMKWQQVQESQILRGEFDPAFLPQLETLGMTMAAGLEAGIF